ncbi:hypothetical protein AALP_AA7G055800 [Arabis alpina]|uniref:Uncharacterized protein n=1 Tax=Arabis alpina TaxID=50452 RepID=A0A087GG40_ARAAL|nr:hypothetical protein AALP_AA7G055800 [Arabis alpina]
MSAERARISNGKGKSIDREPPLKKQRVDTSLAAVVDREASVSGVALPLVSGLLRDEAYAAMKSKASKIKKDCDARLAKLKLKCSKGDEDIASLKTLLSSASDLQSSRIGEAVAAARGEMTRGFAGRVSEVAGLLAEIGEKVLNNMLNLAEIDAKLEVQEVLEIPEYSATDEVGDEVDDEADKEVDDEADDEADEEP